MKIQAINGGYLIQTQESEQIDLLDISNKNLTGILIFSKNNKIKQLNCSNNQITKILYLSDDLEYLDCSCNPLNILPIGWDKILKIRYHGCDLI